MKLREILNEALGLLGYETGDITSGRIITAANSVYADIFFKEASDTDKFKKLTSIEDELELSNYALNNCIVYGLAANLALSEQDNDQQEYFAAIYNDKLRGLPKRRATRQDVQPNPEGV